MTTVARGSGYPAEKVAAVAYRPIISDRDNDRNGLPYVDSANPAPPTASNCDTAERVNAYWQVSASIIVEATAC
jgi:hypothetical protein